MKKLTLITLLTALCFTAMAQKQPVTPPIKKDTAKYQKVIKLSVNDYQALVQLADAYKQSIIYNPKITDKTKEQQDVDMWLFGLPKRILIDSVKITK